MLRIRHIIRGLLCAFAAMLVGCINNYDECPATVGDGEISLSIRMLVPEASPATRTKDPSHALADGEDAEDLINIEGKDYCVYILDENGVIMQRFEPTSTLLNEVKDGGTLLEYTLNGKFQPEGMEKIRVMVMANWNSGWSDAAGGAPVGYGSGINLGFTTMEELYAEGTKFLFARPNSGGSYSSVWMPSASSMQFIPMFGISDVLTISKDGNTVSQGANKSVSINMLRSVAKVEIVDALEESIGNITSVSLSRSNKYGRYILNPHIKKGDKSNEKWNVQDYQVELPSLPDVYGGILSDGNDAFVLNLPFEKAPYTREYTNEDGEKKDCPVYVAYVPEMYLSSSDTRLQRPVFNLTAGGTPYKFDFNNYREGSVNTHDPLSAVLRNHIYRYTVTGVGISAKIDLKVLPWDMQYEDNAFYYDNPVVAQDGWLKWNTVDTSVKEGTGTTDDPVHVSNGYFDFDYNYMTGKYYGEDNDDPGVGELKLKMKSGAYSDNEYVEGTFTLTAPMYSKWYATLVQIDDKRNIPFSFVDVDDNGKVTNIYTDEDGKVNLNVKTEISGTIDGNPITLRIANCAQSVTDSRNEARLVIMVEMPSGQRMEATVVRKPGIGRTNYIIFQERTDM